MTHLSKNKEIVQYDRIEIKLFNKDDKQVYACSRTILGYVEATIAEVYDMAENALEVMTPREEEVE